MFLTVRATLTNCFWQGTRALVGRCPRERPKLKTFVKSPAQAARRTSTRKSTPAAPRTRRFYLNAFLSFIFFCPFLFPLPDALYTLDHRPPSQAPCHTTSHGGTFRPPTHLPALSSRSPFASPLFLPPTRLPIYHPFALRPCPSMAHVATTSSHLPVMSTHIWHSHPRPSSPSNHSAASSASNDLHTSAPTHTSTTASAPASTSLPSTHIWPPLTSSPLSQSPDLPTLSHLPNVSDSTSATPSDLDPSGDADAVFRNLLNLHIDAQSQNQSHAPNVTSSVSVHAQPFRPSPPSHHNTPIHLASSSPLNHLHQDPTIPHHHHFLQPSSAMTSSLMLSLQSSPVAMSLQPIYSPPHPNSASADLPSASRVSPVLTSSPIPPSVSQALHALPPVSVALAQSNQSAPRIKNELYKTEICRSYAESGGFCKYGSKCQFAHGDEELRPVRRHPRYKTKLCRNFVTTGSCPYDSRCRFIHASDLPYTQTSSSIPPSGTATPLSNASAGALGSSAFNRFRHHQPIQNNGSQLPAHVREDYADGLHPLFALSCSSPGAASHHLDTIVHTIHTDQRSTSPSPLADLQTDKSSLSVLPTDQVYHPNAGVFQDYPDSNAIHQTYMHFNGTDYDFRYPTSSFLDSDSVRPVQQFGKTLVDSAVFGQDNGSVARRLISTSDASHESLFSHSAATPRAIPNGKVRGGIMKGLDAIEASPSSGPAASLSGRSRLPVFRNMAFEDAP